VLRADASVIPSPARLRPPGPSKSNVDEKLEIAAVRSLHGVAAMRGE
jgi:hypothetical protein